MVIFHSYVSLPEGNGYGMFATYPLVDQPQPSNSYAESTNSCLGLCDQQPINVRLGSLLGELLMDPLGICQWFGIAQHFLCRISRNC